MTENKITYNPDKTSRHIIDGLIEDGVLLEGDEKLNAYLKIIAGVEPVLTHETPVLEKESKRCIMVNPNDRNTIYKCIGLHAVGYIKPRTIPTEPINDVYNVALIKILEENYGMFNSVIQSTEIPGGSAFDVTVTKNTGMYSGLQRFSFNSYDVNEEFPISDIIEEIRTRGRTL